MDILCTFHYFYVDNVIDVVGGLLFGKTVYIVYVFLLSFTGLTKTLNL